MFEDPNNEDDDTFFTPVANSNLASLFGVSMVQTNSDINTTLTYTAPKQPNLKSEETSIPTVKQKHQSSVILFKEVQAYKLMNNDFVNQGKCGFALIGNESIKIYKLLIYKQKNDIISTTKVSNQFMFTIQKDNSAAFSDDNQIIWNIYFDSEMNLNEFAELIKSKNGLIRNVEAAEVTKPKVLSDLKRESSESDKEIQKQINSDVSDNAKVNAKAKILSRMAKMGQRILLPNTNVSPVLSDGTDSDKSTHKVNRKIKRAVSNVDSAQDDNSGVSQHPLTNSQAIATQYMLLNGQYVPVIQPQLISSTAATITSAESFTSPVLYSGPPAIPYDQLNMYFVENRTHNSEVRMNVLRLTNKVEEILEKVNKLDTNTATNPTGQIDTTKYNREQLKRLVLNLEQSHLQLRTANDNYLKEINVLKEKQMNLVKEIDQKKMLINASNEKEINYRDKIRDLELQLNAQLLSIQNFEKNAHETKDFNKYLVHKEDFDNIEEKIKRIMNSFYRDISNLVTDSNQTQGKDNVKSLANMVVDNTFSIIAAVKEMKVSSDTKM